MIKWLDHRVAQPPSCWVRSDNVYGDPSSLSDARLKTHLDPVSGNQALSVLSQIQSYTYEREDLQEERRLGLISQEVEEACAQLAIDNVIGTRFHQGQDYKTLDYARLVSLLIPAVNKMSQEIQDLKSIINGAA